MNYRSLYPSTGSVLLLAFFLLPLYGQSQKSSLLCDRTGKPATQVPLGQFAALGCKRSLKYFEALDAADAPNYESLRAEIKWTIARDISFRGNVRAGEEVFPLANGVSLIRRYSPSGVSVEIKNDTARPMFMEAYDVPPHSSLIPRAYIAVPPQKTSKAYSIQAQVADPIWNGGTMSVRLLE